MYPFFAATSRRRSRCATNSVVDASSVSRTKANEVANGARDGGEEGLVGAVSVTRNSAKTSWREKKNQERFDRANVYRGDGLVFGVEEPFEDNLSVCEMATVKSARTGITATTTTDEVPLTSCHTRTL